MYRCARIALIAAAISTGVTNAQDCDLDGLAESATVLLSEDFESGLPAGWTATGLWSVTDQCQSEWGPSESGSMHAYFGVPGQCTFATGQIENGQLTTPLLTYPDDALSIRITYASRLGLPDTFTSGATVRVENTGGSSDTTIFVRAFEDPWRPGVFSTFIPVFPGETFQVSFAINSDAPALSDSFGWAIDDVVVEAFPFQFDADGNGVPDACDIHTFDSHLDFEEGDFTDFDSLPAGAVFANRGPGDLTFNVHDSFLSDDLADECASGDFAIQFNDPMTGTFDTGSRVAGAFRFGFTVGADDTGMKLRFCSKYDAEGGIFGGVFSLGTSFDDASWSGSGFDIAGVGVYAGFDGNLTNPLLLLDVSGTTTFSERGVWQDLVLDLSTLTPGTYFIGFGFDSTDAMSNGTLGWQVDNIRIEQDAVGGNLDGNSVPDISQSFAYLDSNEQTYSQLSNAIAFTDPNPIDTIMITPRLLERRTTVFRSFELSEFIPVGVSDNKFSPYGRFFIPPTAVVEIPDEGSAMSSVRIGGTLRLGAFSSLDVAIVEVTDFGRLEVGPFSRLISGGGSISIGTSTGTIELLGGELETNGLFIGDGKSRNGLRDARFEGFGTIGQEFAIRSDGLCVVLADLQVTEPMVVDTGGGVLVQNGVLSALGGFVNNGELIGGSFTPVSTRVSENGGRASQDGAFVRGDASFGQASTLRGVTPDFVLSVSGDLDIQINDNARFGMGDSELRLNANGSQSFEALSRDRGPVVEGLDPMLEGSFPIGTLRVGPLATTATLVDNNDNDPGDSNAEVIYATNVIVEPGATLNLTDHVVYYENAQVLGTVINPGNLIEIEPMLPCPTDLTGDGTTDISDLLQLLAVFNTASASGDITGDGQSDISDLLQLLTQFNTACP